MNLQLIMLENPIIVSDEKVSYVEPKYFYCAKDKDWYKYSPDQYEELEKDDRPIIAGLPELSQIDWNGLEDQFGYLDDDKLIDDYYSHIDDGGDKVFYERSVRELIKKAQGSNNKKFSLEDNNHLNWIFDRLTHVHGENKNYDYMRRFRKIIDSLSQPKSFNIEVEMERVGATKDGLKPWVDVMVPKITDGKIKIIKKL